MYNTPSTLNSTNMKKKAQDIAFNLGCSTNYSGNDKIMYITGVNTNAAIAAIKALRPPFEVKERKDTLE